MQNRRVKMVSNQVKGTLYCVIGVLAITPDSLLVREVSNLPNMQVILYKSLFLALCLLVTLLASEGPRRTVEIFIEIGSIGWAAGAIWGLSNFTVNFAFQNTAVANVLVILAANPMFSSVASYFLLGETVPLRTILAALVCFAAIIIIFYDQLGSGGGDAIGLISALVASFTLGLYFVLIRYAAVKTGTEPDMMPCNIIAGFLIAIALAPLSNTFEPFTLFELTILLLNGMLVLPVAFTLLTIGPSLISAPEVSLYTLIETVLGPIWVWLGGYEAPPISAVFGGSLLIVALAIHSFVALREDQRRRDREKIESTMLIEFPKNNDDNGEFL